MKRIATLAVGVCTGVIVGYAEKQMREKYHIVKIWVGGKLFKLCQEIDKKLTEE